LQRGIGELAQQRNKRGNRRRYQQNRRRKLGRAWNPQRKMGVHNGTGHESQKLAWLIPHKKGNRPRRKWTQKKPMVAGIFSRRAMLAVTMNAA
jgi:hypothetical protein